MLHYQKSGAGPVVVLLHGFLENLTMWDAITQDLAKSYTVISIDLPGHGNSPVLDKAHSMELMAAEVNNLLTHLDIKAAAFVGHSMGGYVAMAMADLFPAIVSGICLLHSGPFADSDERKARREQMIITATAKKEKLVKNVIPNLFWEKNKERLRSEIKDAIKEGIKTPADGIIAALIGMKDRVDRTAVLKQLSYPTHQILGAHDLLVPIHKHLLLGITTSILEHSGHMGHIEETKATYVSINRFCSEVYV